MKYKVWTVKPDGSTDALLVRIGAVKRAEHDFDLEDIPGLAGHYGGETIAKILARFAQKTYRTDEPLLVNCFDVDAWWFINGDEIEYLGAGTWDTPTGEYRAPKRQQRGESP